jgi:predicted MFS family arabinose efflux permease
MVLFFAIRIVLSSANRIVYPFLPSLARGLGISLASAGILVSLRMMGGIAAPLLGPVVDQNSRSRTMQLAMLVFALAGVLLIGSGTLAAAAIAFVLFGLTKVLYDLSAHSYLADRIPYRSRGRAVGFLELSWSSAWLLGVPMSGFLIERFGWRAPWAALAGLGLVGWWLTRMLVPRKTVVQSPATKKPNHPSLVNSWRTILRCRAVPAFLMTALLMVMGIEIPFIMYGAWIEDSYGLGLSALGLASIVVGIAEAGAELGTAALTDRLGKRRSVVLGLLGLSASLLALPSISRAGLGAALAGVTMMMVTFEFAVVSSMPMATELVPGARATTLSLHLMAVSIGRMLGAFLGGWLWQGRLGGIQVNAYSGAAVAIAACLLLVWRVPELPGAGNEGQSGTLAP